MVQSTQDVSGPADAATAAAGNGAVSRIAVDVTFLRMVTRPGQPPPALPPGYEIVRVPAPTIGFYRYLYGTVGREYCWWLRRMAADAELAALLADPQVHVHVLYHQGEPGGFFELDGRLGSEVNISYFGLMPHLVGKGVGAAFVGAAVHAAWVQVDLQLAMRSGSRPGGGIRVNTCTADHPRALGSYVRTGFRPVRTVREIWNIPDRLGLPIPQHLRA